MLGSIVLVTIGKRQGVSNRRMRLSGWTSFFPSSASEQKKCCMTGTKKIATMFLPMKLFGLFCGRSCLLLFLLFCCFVCVLLRADSNFFLYVRCLFQNRYNSYMSGAGNIAEKISRTMVTKSL